MTKFALMVMLEAKPGKEKEVEEFLKSALPLVNAEPKTVAWYAVKIGTSKFGIFDTFENDADRQVHLKGEVAKALMQKAPELFATAPQIDQVEILAEK